MLPLAKPEVEENAAPSSTVSAETDHSNTAMIGYFLPEEMAAKLAIPEGNSLGGQVCSPESLHITLAFLGDIAGLDQVKIQQALSAFTFVHGPVSGQINGSGRFVTGEEMDPVYLSVDIPSLPEFREELVEYLEQAGITVVKNHGFTPHITVMYLPRETETPSIVLPDEPLPITIDTLHLAWGDEHIAFPLTGEKSVAPDTLVMIGGGVKALGVKTENGTQYGKIGGHLILYGGPDKKDALGDYFTPDTYFGPGDGDQRDVMMNHGYAIKTGNPAVDAQMLEYTKRLLTPMHTKRDAIGIWAETVLDLSDEYQAMVYGLSQKGALKWSSGVAPHMIVREPDGKIVQWPIAEGSLTPTPAEPRMLEHRVMPLKALLDIPVVTDEQIGESGGKGAAQTGAPAGRKPDTATYIKSLELGAKAMNLIEAIKKLVPGLSDEQVQAIAAVLGLAGMVEATVPESPEPEGTMSAGETPEPMRSVDLKKLSDALKSMGFHAQAQPQAQPAAVRPVYNNEPERQNGATKAIEAAYLKRYGDEDDGKKAILNEVIGKDYRQRIQEQTSAFGKYLRRGEFALSADEYRSLKTMYFPLDAIVKMAGEMEIGSIKTVMVEAQGDLGGFAVPPMIQSEISARLPGMTAVRSAGARVVTLTNGNSIEIPLYDGGDDRYRGNLRGAWGDETQVPTEKNAKLKLVTVIAHVYTYKVGMSQSLVEDAANLVSLVQADITDVLALDEDDAFLVADGVGKPLGILPAGANALTLTEVNSGAAATLTGDGIKALKRGVASQYRSRGVWVGNSDTYGDIEQIKGADGQYLFPDLSDNDMLLSRRAYESEAMADVAADAFPLIFGDMSGYTIVERLGMSIQRFQDSNTGPNKVEYHVRRRIGGRVEQPWKFAVQKVAA